MVSEEGGAVNHHYTIRDQETLEILAEGTRKECAEQLGVTASWVKQLTRKSYRGTKYLVEAAPGKTWEERIAERWLKIQKELGRG